MNENLHGRNSLFENRATSPGLLVKALFVSLVCHVLVFLGLMVLPDISFRRKPPVPAVMNVTMVNLASPGSGPKAGPIAPESSGGKAGNGKIAESKPAPPKPEPPKAVPPKAEAPKPAPQNIPEPPKPVPPKPEPPKPEPPKPTPKPEVKQTPPEAVSLAPQKPKEKQPEPKPPKPSQASAEKSLKETLSRLEKKVAQAPPDPLKSTLDKLRSTVAKEEAAMPKSREPSGNTGIGGSGTSGSASSRGGQGGDSATGIPGLGLQAMQAIDFYRSLIGMTIEKNWFFSDQFTAGRKDFATVIVIKILPNGQIADIWFERKSGNAAFDDSAFKAVKKSNPLPPLPKEYTRPYYEVGLVFTPAGLNKG